MRRFLAASASALVLGLAACGGEDEGGEQATTPTAEQPAATQPEATQPEAEGGAEAQQPADLLQETEAVVNQVAAAAQRLAEDPNADVDAELQQAQQQAEELARAAREEAPEARTTAEDLAEEGRQQLSEEQRQEVRDRLARVNEQTAETAERLRRVTDPDIAARIAREDLRDVTADLRAAADVLSDEVPPEVRERVEQLRDRLGELQR